MKLSLNRYAAAIVSSTAMLLCLGAPAQASLIGDTVRLDFIFPTEDSVLGGLDILVQEGPVDFAPILVFEDNLPVPIGFLDVEAEGFSLTINESTAFCGECEFNGFRLSDLDWVDSPSKRLTGATVSTDATIPGFEAINRVSFTGDSFSFNAAGLSVDAGTTFTGRFETTAVPTPALLPGLIGFGMTIIRKRKGAVTQS